MVLPARREPSRLKGADRPVRKLHNGLERVVDVDMLPARPARVISLGDKRRGQGGDLRRLPNEEPRKVDDVRAKVAKRAAPGGIGVVPPLRNLRAVPPLLQVARPEMEDSPEGTALEKRLCLPDCRHESIVERTHVLDAGLSDGIQHEFGLFGGPPERLLAQDVLARLRRRNRRLGVNIVWPTVIEQLDRVVFQHLAPVEVHLVVPEPSRRGGHRLVIAATQRDHPGHRRQRADHVRDRAERVRMRLPHEGVAKHPDADRGDRAVGLSRRSHRQESDLFAHRLSSSHPLAPYARGRGWGRYGHHPRPYPATAVAGATSATSATSATD